MLTSRRFLLAASLCCLALCVATAWAFARRGRPRFVLRVRNPSSLNVHLDPRIDPPDAIVERLRPPECFGCGSACAWWFWNNFTVPAGGELVLPFVTEPYAITLDTDAGRLAISGLEYGGLDEFVVTLPPSGLPARCWKPAPGREPAPRVPPRVIRIYK